MPPKRHNSFFLVSSHTFRIQYTTKQSNALQLVFQQLTVHDRISKKITFACTAMWIWLNSCIPLSYKGSQFPGVKCDNVTTFSLSAFSDLLRVKHGRNGCGTGIMLCTPVIVWVDLIWALADPGFVRGTGPRTFLRDFANGVQQSHPCEVSQYWTVPRVLPLEMQGP